MRKQTEAQLQVQVAEYIRLKYPNVLFHSDYGSGVKLTMSQAVMQKRQNGGRRSWPDLFIAKALLVFETPVDIKTDDIYEKVITARQNAKIFHGLFLELKREGTRIFKKDGTLVADEHIREQFDLLESLRREGYIAEFACGFDEAKKIIDDYLAE